MRALRKQLQFLTNPAELSLAQHPQGTESRSILNLGVQSIAMHFAELLG